jgi:hypothetical protein
MEGSATCLTGGHEGLGLRESKAVGNSGRNGGWGNGGSHRDGVVSWESSHRSSGIGGSSVWVGQCSVQENLGLGGSRGESKDNLGKKVLGDGQGGVAGQDLQT